MQSAYEQIKEKMTGPGEEGDGEERAGGGVEYLRQEVRLRSMDGRAERSWEGQESRIVQV
eukprot:765986-Hanusia_phi.AAC.5